MTWILTNDDGIDAPGIAALSQAITQIAPKQTTLVVAPIQEQSGCGHQVTTGRPIIVESRIVESRVTGYAIGGTPADCVRLGLGQLCPETQWVLSGINAGGNLGADIYISGTVAAVREAALHGIPGIAVSHYRQGNRPIDWGLASRLTAMVLAKLFSLPLQPGEFWNVNLPHLAVGMTDPEMIFCQPCQQPLPNQYQQQQNAYLYAGRYSERPQLAGTDVTTCFSGAIAITQLRV
jgi:5'-nucleotidase